MSMHAYASKLCRSTQCCEKSWWASISVYQVLTSTGGCQFTNSAASFPWEPQILICVGVWSRMAHISILQLQFYLKMWEEMQSRRTGRAEFYGWEEKKKKWYTRFFSFFFLTKFESGIKRKGRLNECVCECERQRHCIWRIKKRKSPNFFFSDDFFEHGPYCSEPMGADWSKKEIVIMIKIESLKFYYSYKYNLPLFKNRFCHLFIKPASFQVFKVLSVPFINRGIYF